MKRENWRHYDVVMKYRSEKLKQPVMKFKAKKGAKSETARVLDGVSIVEIGGFIPCAIHPDLPIDMALAKLREYMIKENPQLEDSDFELRMGWNDHMMTRYPKQEKIIFITPGGCTRGLPKQ